MNDIWKEIFKNYIKLDKATKLLGDWELIDKDECNRLRLKLLDEIIGDMESEVEDLEV